MRTYVHRCHVSPALDAVGGLHRRGGELTPPSCRFSTGVAVERHAEASATMTVVNFIAANTFYVCLKTSEL